MQDGFLLYAVLEVAVEHGILLKSSLKNISALVKEILVPFYDAFSKKWSGQLVSQHNTFHVIVKRNKYSPFEFFSSSRGAHT